MDLGLRTPLVDLFRKGEAPRDVKLLAAQGDIAPRAQEQLALLALLVEDADPEVSAAARATLERVPIETIAAVLGHPETPSELRSFFAARGVAPASPAHTPPPDGPIIGDESAPLPEAAIEEGEPRPGRVVLSMLPVVDRIKLAMRGTREQRSALIRDANKVVAMAVLSSPKLTESEVESYARMATVSEDVLRVIGSTRAWTKQYPVVAAIVRNPKTPLAISLSLVSRLNDRDIKMLSVDRNVPEGLRTSARRTLVASQSRKQ